MATKQLTGTPERADHSTAPLPQPAVDAMSRLSAAFAPVVAEQHRIERTAAGLRNGETTVINGTPVTAVSLEAAEALTRYETASLHAAELAAQSASGEDLPAVDVRSWEFAEELMAGARATLSAAGMLHLIEAAR
jgi:hypothetical protein